MTNAGKSVFYFGFYVLLVGVLLLAVPQIFLTTLKLQDIPQGWARIIGLLAVIIGVYDIVSGRNNLLPALKASVYLRFFFFLGVLFLIVSSQMSKEALPLGIIDAVGATWTLFALRSQIIFRPTFSFQGMLSHRTGDRHKLSFTRCFWL